VWQWTGSGFARQADLGTALGIDHTYPANSMTLLVVPGTGGGTGTTTTPVTTTPVVTTKTVTTTKTTPTPRKPALPTVRATSTTLKRASLSLTLRCAKTASTCSSRLAVTSGRTRLAAAKLSLAAGRTRTFALKLSKANAKRVRAWGHRGRTVRLTFTAGRLVRHATIRLRGR
jgi:hypothetical protein